MGAPWRGQIASLPSPHRQRRARDYRNPRGEVKDAVGERVVLEPGHPRCGTAPLIGEHVMPLENLVEQDSVDESARSWVNLWLSRSAAAP